MITKKRANMIIQRYHTLRDLAHDFILKYDDTPRSPRDVELDWSGNIEYKKNTACHCHPEMESFRIPSEKFYEWLEQQK